MRALFQFLPGLERARIARPGFDVNASIENMLLHESSLFSQLMQFGYVANPGTGVGVNVTVQRAMGNNVSVYAVADYGGAKNYPACWAYASGTNVVPFTGIHYEVLGESTLSITFGHTVVPYGCYYSLWRRS